MSQPPPNSPPKPERRWSGGAIALLVIGLAILILSGLCTGAGAIPMLFEADAIARSSAYAFLVFGVSIMAVGAFLVWLAFIVRPRQ